MLSAEATNTKCYGLWFRLQTVEAGDLESAIRMTEVVEAMNSVNSE
jgi:hypothetical protein